MTGLEGFSDWVLALLTRLFLYPGGVWLLVVLAGLRFACGGAATIRPTALATVLLKSSLPALSVAWAAISMLPLPGASALSAPIDRLALTALVLASLALDNHPDLREVAISASMALAVLSPLAQGDALLREVRPWEVSSVLSMLCVAVALLVLSNKVVLSLPGAVRWLSWLGLGFAPVLAGWGGHLLPGILGTSLVYATSIAILSTIGRLTSIHKPDKDWAIVTVAYGLAALSLLAALLGY
ncbi:MAG TPA: hypothetical protein VJ183_01970 [Chloroflexia bacterium]|nr:hypothetical protein [Chloroflexia bacterium]